jgi:predicted MFS family arabinose efflux permease
MTTLIRKSLRESKTARWTALTIVSFTMMCGYYFSDVMGPLKGLLENRLYWTSTEYGFFTSAYGWFNVFLFMLIIGGIILDRAGVRFTGMMAAILMVAGAFIKYWAISTHLLDGESWKILFWTAKAQVWIAGLGYAVFGVGIEIAGVTVTKVIVKWFKGKEMALAMGLQVATARIGTGIALAVSLPLADKIFRSLPAPVLLGLILLCAGLISYFIYTFQDKKLDAEIKAGTEAEQEPQEKFQLRDIRDIFTNKAWWYIALLCVLFYSAVFPFLKYATDLMTNKFSVNPDFAGLIPSLLPFGTILLTPIFGNMYDRKGKGASIMILGAIMLIFIHGMYAIPALHHWTIAVVLILLLGVAFSLVPSALWPSVPKIVEEKKLGTAYAMIFWVQNWGLMGIPLLIGRILDKYCIVEHVAEDGSIITGYNYTLPMLIFMMLGIASLFFAFLLKHEDREKGYGLEKPNMIDD